MKIYLLLILVPIIVMLDTANGGGLDRVIAHRGASYDAPENTSAAIQLAISRGAKIIEFDVRETADKELYLFHDSDLKRLCGKEIHFNQVSSDDVAKLDVGSWFTGGKYPDEKPLLLRTAIEQCLAGGVIPLIERKSGPPEAYARVISDLDAVSEVIVQSFNWEFIAGVQKLLPALRVGALGSKKLSEKKEALLKLNANLVGWSNNDIEAGDFMWLKENKFKIAIWTVNDPKRAQFLIEQGVHYIITDRPKYIADRLE